MKKYEYLNQKAEHFTKAINEFYTGEYCHGYNLDVSMLDFLQGFNFLDASGNEDRIFLSFYDEWGYMDYEVEVTKNCTRIEKNGTSMSMPLNSGLTYDLWEAAHCLIAC